MWFCAVDGAFIPAGSLSRGGDATVYVWHNPTVLAHSCLLCSCVYLCLYHPLSCISSHKLSRQLSVFWLCSSGLISALLYLFMKVFFSPGPEGRPGMSDVSPLSGISGLSFGSTLLSPLLFFWLVQLLFLSYLFFCLLIHSPEVFPENSSLFFVKR